MSKKILIVRITQVLYEKKLCKSNGFFYIILFEINVTCVPKWLAAITRVQFPHIADVLKIFDNNSDECSVEEKL